ncbi:LysM peptidoglycan-binding domain-containing protein [uncultured Sphingomonas sp.]|mgnify:CR=1 FL=1|uniref:LysM peptidoglycan-binding domain-containing protein n=1 Tax=uncultured Sphingomonas sp. TaxID=158754 RepID=UPI00259561DB|nr:LysM peptidoglycan-binding domain-containing protein [uncultured Sphingomonas sp.]
MVAIFTGAGTGFERGSGSKLGSSGLLGSAGFGRSGEQIFLNAANGNLLISQRDEFLVGRGPDAGVSRTYNSLGNQSDDNGDNWRQSTQRAVSLNGTANSWGSSVTHQLGDGSEIVYYWSGSAYITTEGGGVHDKITWDGSVFRWTDGDTGTVETYAPGGPSPWYRLSTVSDTSGNALTYGYTGDKLTSITTANGETLTYAWSGNHITEVNSGDGTLTRYYYDGYDRLSRVDAELTSGGAVYSTYYSYHGSSKLVATISETDGSYLAIGYDGANRVTSLTQTVAAGDARTTSIAYGADYTVVTDPAGQATTLHYNYAGALTQITAPPASAGAAPQTVTFAYDEDGNLSLVTDPAGQTTSYTHDSWGNVVFATDRLDNITQRVFGPGNKLLIETRPGSGSTRFAYDSANRLVYTVSAEGRVTRNWYDSYGQLYFVSEFPDHRYDLSGLAANQAPSQSQLDGWCAGLGDTASSQVTYMLRDARGNLTQRLRGSANNNYASYNGWGGYTHEYYTYDSAGRLLSSVVAGQNTQYYVYDGLNRLVSQTDVNGGTTSIVFADAATQTVITLANGFVQTSTYNKAGELVSFTESGEAVAGGTASYAYDKNGRLRMTTDATGVKSYYVYDKAGRKVADIDAYGSVTEYQYDLNNRLIGTVRYENGIMGGAGAMATLGDPNNSLDMASIRPNPNGHDQWTWTVYDKEGRVIEAIEGDGSVTAYEYDASGRLVKTTGYANKLGSGQLDAFKVNGPSAWLPAAHAKDSIARIFYDKDGRKIGALDGEGYLTRTIYDGSGRKVQEIAYANITSAALRASGSLQSLIDSAGTSASDRSIRYVYDGQDLLRFTIDALGQVTEFGYEDRSWLWSAFRPVRWTKRYAGTIGALSSYSYASVKNAVAALASDPANRTGWAVYDSAGRLAYSIDAGGAVIGYSYDTRGQLVRKAEYANLRWTGSLPSKGDMDSWVASYPTANDRITRYYYSARGELRFTIDAEGYVTRTDYDAEGRVSATVRWDNAVSANDGWTIATVSNAQSGDYVASNSYYDANGRLTLTTTNAGQSRRLYYYATGLLAWDIASEGGQDDSRTYYVYDAAGRKAAEYAAFGTAEQAITTYTYNGLGDLIAVSDPNAHTTSFEYDHAGRVIRQANAYGSPTVFEYNAFGEVTRTINARGFSTYSYYDQAGRIVATRDAEDHVTETRYTVFGEVAWIKQAYNKATNTAGVANWPDGYAAHVLDAVTSFEYDKLGRLAKTIDAEGYYEQYTLDAFGQRASIRNKLGGVTTNVFDRRGLLVSETLPMASVDNLGSIVAATVTNKFGYDARGNRIWMDEAYALAEHRYTAFVYDKANRLIEKRGDTVGYIDQSNHIGVSYASVIERYKYDMRGNLIETINANGGRTLFYYDDLNRKIADITAVGTLSTYSYDAAGNMTVSRTYGAPVSLPALAGGTPPAAPGGDLRQTSYTYDNVNRLLTTSVAGVRTGSWNGASFVTTTAPVTTSFEYDVVGNVVRATDGNGASTYSYYDKRGGKVAQVDQEGYVTRWTLDGEGNVTSERRYATQTSGATVSSQPGVPDAGADRITNFTYDRNGRRLTEQRLNVEAYGVDIYSGQLYGASGTATISYSYNGLGQVTRKTEATGDYIDYSYDATGRLTQESRAPYKEYYNGDDPIRPTVRYYYNGINNLAMTRQGAEDLNGGDRITRYTYGAGQRLLTMTDPSGAGFDYYYDLAGNIVRQNYTRQKSDGSSAYEGVLYTRDVLGRVTAQVAGSWNGSAWIKGDVQQTQYNAYGEVSQRGLNDGWQEKFYYDGAGRLYKTNSGDGVWRFFVYDGKGNQTAAIESEGSWIGSYELDGAISAATNGFAYPLGSLYVDGINVTINAYDRRGQATSTIQTQRQLSETGGPVNLTVARGYNAFGEVAWERDARGNQTSYTYNSMGRATMVQRPSVQITTEYNYSYWTNPTDYYYYDLAGRTIGVQDANGNRTTRRLLAGTGYGATEALVAWEWHADGGILKRGYDRFGDLRRVTDEVNRTTAMDYDAMGRLTQVTRPSGQAEYYAYDVLGQRIRHWNSHYGTANVERTDYDVQGRVVRQVAFGDDAMGAATTISYVWSWQSTNGLGSFGGWYQTTTYANGRTSVQQEDMFGHVLYTVDLGGHATSFNYDYAGRMIQRTGGETINYNYLNTGLLGSMTSGYGSPATAPNNFGETYQVRKTAYSYDASGNKLTEAYTVENGGWYDNGWYEYNYDYGYYDQYWVSNWQYLTSTTTYQNASASYDALGRMTSWAESGNGTTPAASIAYSYDANGNVRRTYATYYVLDQNGNPWYQSNQDYWYRYDAMNRVVTSKGQLSGSSIVRGTQGIDLAYNVAGERVQSTRNAMTEGLVSYMQYDPNAAGGWGDWVNVNAMVPYEAERREDYAYDADGRLSAVYLAESGYYDNGDGTLTVTAPPATGGLKANYYYDGMGRLTRQVDWLGYGYSAAYDHTLTYNLRGQVESEVTVQLQGFDTITTYSSTDFGFGSNYALGAAVSISTTTYKNGGYQNYATTTNSFAWFAGAVQASTTYAQSGQAVQTSNFTYGASGDLLSVWVGDGRPHSISFTNDMNGQAIRRDEYDNNPNLGDPHEVWYRFNGKQMGYTGNNGTQNTDYQSSINGRVALPGNGAFQNGANYGSSYADFDQSFSGLTSYSQGGAGGSYTVRAGDTLQSIAAQLWGDSALWYRLAEANGMAGASGLIQGQALTIPSGVLRSTNNAGTFNPYNPADILGDTSPTTPQPQKAAKKNKCGVFGQILLAVISVAVAVALPHVAPAVFGGVWGGVGAAVVANVVSQGVGIVTGIQDKFSFKSLAMTAVTAGVAAGLDKLNMVVDVGNKVANAAINGVISNAVSQGIGVVTGLQPKFDWAGVAAAGVGAAAGAAIGGALKYNADLKGFHLDNSLKGLAAGMANNIANAATRSLVAGTDFGDNLIAALPDTLAQFVVSVGKGAIEGTGGARKGGVTAETTPSPGAGPVAGTVAPVELGQNTAMDTADGVEIVVTGRRKSSSSGTPRRGTATIQFDEEVEETPLPMAPATVVGFAIDINTHNARLMQWGPWIAEHDPTMQLYDYTNVIAGFKAEEEYILKINAAAAPELNRVDMFFGGIIAAAAAPATVPLLLEGGLGTVLGALALSADANHALGASAPFTGATKLPLDYLAGDGASNILDVSATGGNLLYGGYRGIQAWRSASAAKGISTISASSPGEIFYGYGKLSGRQQRLLDQLPSELSEITLRKSAVNVTDLAALTAKTGDEFALFTRGSQRLLIRGNKTGVPLLPEEISGLSAGGYRWSAHTQPGNRDLFLDASAGDRYALQLMGQERSLILNSTGRRNVFDATYDYRVK